MSAEKTEATTHEGPPVRVELIREGQDILLAIITSPSERVVGCGRINEAPEARDVRDLRQSAGDPSG